MNKRKIPFAIISLLLVVTLLSGCLGGDAAVSTTQWSDASSTQVAGLTEISEQNQQTEPPRQTEGEKTTESAKQSNYKVNLNDVPAFSGKPYVAVNGNIPGLSAADRTERYFEKYTRLDNLGRCGVAFACLGPETMPTEERGAIGSVKPSGWHTVKYDIVDGKYLYNRCHLIGFQLSGENANPKNLITGTRYMNVDGMLPFENMVADYIKETGNHVLYRVTPVFKGAELVCRGVQIEAYSVEDEGDGVFFNVFCYNSQPGISIDYATGYSELSGNYNVHEDYQQPYEPIVIASEGEAEQQEKMVWIPKTGAKYHNDRYCSNMNKPSLITLEEAKERGYTPCRKCCY